MSEHEISRREVVVGIMVAGAMCGVAGCTQKAKEKPPAITSGVVNVGPAARYHAGSVHQDFLPTYGIILVNDSGTVLAIRPKCTHLGCTVKWVAGDFQFECPCHGSEFDILGRPTKGPAKRPLPGVAAQEMADGTLTVDLDKLYAM